MTERTERTARLKEIMSPGVQTVPREADVEAAAVKMKELGVGAMPVCDGERLVGMLTDRDITIRVVGERRDPKAAKVGEVMTTEVIYCYEDQDIEAAARLMQEKQIRRLPILSRERRLVGLVSIGDVAVKTEDAQMSGEALKAVSQPGGSHAQ